jgi:hypothetical protein
MFSDLFNRLSRRRHGKKAQSALQRIRHERIDKETQKYIRYCQKKWHPEKRDERAPVVLVGMFDAPLVAHSLGLVGNFLADHYRARLATTSFVPYRTTRLDAIVTAYGAPVEVGFQSEERFREPILKRAKEVYANLEGRGDVLRICHRGIPIGDMIYDTYLRQFFKATLEYRDPALLQLINDALLNVEICLDYLGRNDVKAFLGTDLVYQFDGILARICAAEGIPAFTLSLDPLVLKKNDSEFAPGDRADFASWPARGRYRQVPKLMSSLSPERQQAGRRWSEANMKSRFAGKADATNMVWGETGTVYHAPTTERLLSDTGRPRCLIMLHDYCDGCHYYPLKTFEDFYDWTIFTLTEAAKTPFDWHVKPHPLRYDKDIDRLTFAIADEIKRRFPNVRVLSPECSNRQILQEGVHSMFTLHGTAALEFACHNIPVVSAGTSPYTKCRFHLCPADKAEYAELIAKADRLEVKIDLDELHLAHYLADDRFYLDQLQTQISVVPSSLLEHPDFRKNRYRKAFFQNLATHDDPAHDAAIKRCVQECLKIQGEGAPAR